MEVDKRDLIERIQRLTKKEKLHILNILRNDNVNFTKNNNGYFFNLNDVEDDAIDKMVQCLELIEKNRDLIAQMDKRREELLTYYKSLIDEKLALSNEKKRIEHINKIMLKDYNQNIWIQKDQKLKGKHHANNTRDPDDLIKEYNEASKFKFKKGTSLHRLYTILKSHRFTSSSKNIFNDNEMFDSEDHDSEGHSEAHSEVHSEAHSEVHDSDDELSDGANAEDDIEETAENDDDEDVPNDVADEADENDRNNVEHDVEENNEIDYEEDVELDDNSKDAEEDVQTNVEIRNQPPNPNGNVYMYLKGLLKRKGYSFSSNDLVYQEYIL